MEAMGSTPQKQEPTSPTLLTIPLELRFRIYDQLLNTHHTILISPNGTKRGILKPLVLTCTQIHLEIPKWLKGQKHAHIIRSPTFGVFNDSLTTFKLSWLNHCSSARVPRGMISIHLYTDTRYQRCYTPNHPARDIERLEMWQRAMDITGSDRRDKINLTLVGNEMFREYGVLEDFGKLLSCQGEDWKVLDERRFENGGLPKQGQIVWSKGWESHGVHQEYWRQYPAEEGRVRKVECGLAFEFVLVGEEMDFVEVE